MNGLRPGAGDNWVISRNAAGKRAGFRAASVIRSCAETCIFLGPVQFARGNGGQMAVSLVPGSATLFVTQNPSVGQPVIGATDVTFPIAKQIRAAGSVQFNVGP